jgi:hypothetical protein
MIGLIWNCKGVAKKGMGTKIKDLLAEFNDEFIGPQETMRKKILRQFL